MLLTLLRTDRHRAGGDAIARRPRTRVRSWKGRAAMSLVTDSAVPTFVTAGTRRTRVSEMRLPVRATRRRQTAARPANTPSERRGGHESTRASNAGPAIVEVRSRTA